VAPAEGVSPHGQHQQCRQLRDPACDVPQHVERCVVGPLHIVDDQQ
jgi:hypothetical protein